MKSNRAIAIICSAICAVAWTQVDTTPQGQVLVHALDISVYTGTISASNVTNWKAAGYSHLIVGCQNTTTAKQQLQTAVDGGMTVDVYIYLYFANDMTTQVNKALNIANGFPVGRLWLDAEDTSSSFTKSEYIAKIQDAINACGTMPYGIYTGNWWWTPRIGSSHPFTGVPLWYSYYDNVDSLDTWSTQKFGGWSSPTGKQYKGDVYVDGKDTDKSVIWIDQPGTGNGGGGSSSGGSSGSSSGTSTSSSSSDSGNSIHKPLAYPFVKQNGSCYTATKSFGINSDVKLNLTKFRDSTLVSAGISSSFACAYDHAGFIPAQLDSNILKPAVGISYALTCSALGVILLAALSVLARRLS